MTLLKYAPAVVFALYRALQTTPPKPSSVTDTIIKLMQSAILLLLHLLVDTLYNRYAKK